MPADVKYVLFSGAGGGLVSWAFTLMTGATFGLGAWLALPLCVILGTAAALVAVYVITPTDTKKTGQLIGFAVLCGFLWKPVLDAGRIVIGERIEAARSVADVKQQVAELKRAETPESVGSNAHQAAAGAAELLRSSQTLDNPTVDKQATTGATNAVNAIAETSTANPLAATLALREIKEAADKADKPEVSRLAARKLETIGRQFPGQVAPVMDATPP